MPTGKSGVCGALGAQAAFKQRSQGKARLEIWGIGHGEAHQKHVRHVCDSGYVEIQRLVERRDAACRARKKRGHTIRVLRAAGPRVDRGRREGRGPAWCANNVHQEGEKTAGDWPHDTRAGGTHLEHGAHVCDFGRVKAQWLVKRLRVLPSRKEGIRIGVLEAKGMAQVGVMARAAGGTRNICSMFVTLEVSQLEMSELKFSRR